MIGSSYERFRELCALLARPTPPATEGKTRNVSELIEISITRRRGARSFVRNDDTTINGWDHFIHRSLLARGGSNAKRDGKGQCQSPSMRQAPNFVGKNVIFIGDQQVQAAHSPRVLFTAY